MRRAVLILLPAFIGVWAALLLGGCTTAGPAPIEIGAEAPPPAGCIEGRARGVDC